MASRADAGDATGAPAGDFSVNTAPTVDWTGVSLTCRASAGSTFARAGLFERFFGGTLQPYRFLAARLTLPFRALAAVSFFAAGLGLAVPCRMPSATTASGMPRLARAAGMVAARLHEPKMAVWISSTVAPGFACH